MIRYIGIEEILIQENTFMKKTILIIVLVGLQLGLHAQTTTAETNSITEPRKFYLGFSTGINQGTGLIGPTVELQMIRNLTVFGGAGLGSWGSKVTGGLKYYINYPGNWAFGIGYSHATGVNDVTVNLADGFIEGQSGQQKTKFKLLPCNTVNISATKYWLLGKQQKNRMHLEFGYAIPTSDNRYETAVTLTDKGQNFMKILQPGGLILGVGFSFGL